MKLKSVNQMAALLGFGIFAVYQAMSPMTTGGRGYISEEIDSGMRILEIFNAWVKGRPVPPMVWTRHGAVPVLFDLPFIKLGKLFASPDLMMSISPIFFTAALLTILFLWLRKLTSPGISLLLTLTGAFATTLWPYAYVGLETKQSFFVFLAGYLGLANGRIRNWPKLMLFGVACGLAMGVKSTGIVMWPAFAFLWYVQFRLEWKSHLRQAVSAAFVIAAVWGVTELARRPYWNPHGGGYVNFRGWMVDQPLQIFMNAIGVFGSPTKGLFVFAPVLLLSVYAIPRAVRAQREITIFALMVTGLTTAFIALLIVQGDEIWGQRYLHVAVAPLLLLIGIAWPRFEWKSQAPMLILAAVGLAISFLGAFYYYGQRLTAVYDGGQNTMEWLVGDPVWNEIHFNAGEFRLWLKGCPPTRWTPAHNWVRESPAGPPPWKAIELRDYCQPQALLLREWHSHLDGMEATLFKVCAALLPLGLLSLIAVLYRTIREAPPSKIPHLAGRRELSK
jgi:hypothetical protein